MIRAPSGGARSSSAVIALTVPAVPTGMNTGVGMSPRGVCKHAGARVAVRGEQLEREAGRGQRVHHVALGGRASRRRS